MQQTKLDTLNVVALVKNADKINGVGLYRLYNFIILKSVLHLPVCASLNICCMVFKYTFSLFIILVRCLNIHFSCLFYS